jgi:hypothetical protein
MKGTPGDLNRMIMPMSAYPGGAGALKSDEYVVNYQGVDYFASDYISRDCYFGTFFGLSHVYDLVDDPQAKADAGRLIECAIDYLLANNWTWRKRDGSFGERWQGVLEQQYAWLEVAARVNPAKYGATRAAYAGFADIMWTGFWIAVMDPYYSYYKFELGGGSIYTVLRLENDPVRWQREYQSMAIMRHFIGHHENALFNGYYFAADASSKSRLGDENKLLLTCLLRQPRRQVRYDITGDTTIEHSTYTLPVDPNLLYPDPNNTTPATIDVAKYPIPVEKRCAAGFAWSVSPFRLKSGNPWAANPNWEGESQDFTLPYWMARYYGAIAAPTRTVSGTASATAVGATAVGTP